MRKACENEATTTVKKKNIAWTLAENIVNTRYEALPKEAVQATKKSILDTLGVIAAASGIATECRLLVDFIKEAGGKEESTIIGFGHRVPAWMAAFANGAMGHCLDYDDLHYKAFVHPSSSVVSAGLAVAERVGNVHGKDFITAVALGDDLACRMGLSIHYKIDWLLTSVLGVFGATAASGKVLRLDERTMVNALSIALNEAAGTREMRYSLDNHLGGMRDGYPARGGVFSALLAKQGIKGPESCFDGKAGLFNVYFGGNFKPEVLTAHLGKQFEVAHVGIKAWPTCGNTHVYIDGTLRIITRQNLRPEDIDRITLFVGELAMYNCQPLEERRRPPSPIDAKYSIPFSVAIAAVKRRVAIGDVTMAAIKEQEVLEMAQKVGVIFDARFNSERGAPPGMVEIATKDGRVFSERLEVGYGHPSNPISEEDAIKKFLDCVSYSARPVPRNAAEKIVDTVMNLEKQQNVSSVVRLLS